MWGYTINKNVKIITRYIYSHTLTVIQTSETETAWVKKFTQKLKHTAKMQIKPNEFQRNLAYLAHESQRTTKHYQTLPKISVKYHVLRIFKITIKRSAKVTTPFLSASVSATYGRHLVISHLLNVGINDIFF